MRNLFIEKKIKKMESSFRHTLFNDLINIKDNLSDSDYEHEVFNYLKNLDKHPSYDQLKLYSNKLKNLKGKCHFYQ
jgi:hypothetical protein